MYKIGIISDTHGVLPGKVFELFQGVRRIIHAGDIGRETILTELEIIAPVDAVYGNVDGAQIRKRLRERLLFDLYGFEFDVTHIADLVAHDSKPTIRISGHTHEARVLQQGHRRRIQPREVPGGGSST